MNLKKIKAYHYFWIVAFFILIYGYLKQETNQNNNLDINNGDSYYVCTYMYIVKIIFSFYFILGFGYWFVQKVLKRKMIDRLTKIHSSITIGAFFFCFCDKLMYDLAVHYPKINTTIIILYGLLLVAGQVAYIINLSIAIFRKRNHIIE